MLEKGPLARKTSPKNSAAYILWRVLIGPAGAVVAAVVMVVLLRWRSPAYSTMNSSRALRNRATTLIVGRWRRIAHPVIVILARHDAGSVLIKDG